MEAVDRHRYRCQRANPSFSATLLDKIYRSIGERDDDEESVVCSETMRKRQSIDGSVRRSGGSMYISEMVVGRKSVAGFETSSQRSEGNSYFNSNLGSSCSRYSSSEAETIYRFPARPRPIRTRTNECNKPENQTDMYAQKHQPEDLQPKAKREGKLGKTKSGAMKIYGYLKKGKRPISPGGRLATFLISLFSTGNAKKSFCTGGDDEPIVHAKRESKSANASIPSSASSFTRSCLSKTPSSSSRGNLITDMKRSVRFYPGTVIVDEHRQPRGRKSSHFDGSDSVAVKSARNSVNEEIQKHLTEKSFRIEESTRNMMKNYQKKVKYAFDSSKTNVIDNGEDYDVEDDSASYASSDLFELDHISAIEIDRCMQELPLYETTSVVANRAIANGLFV